MQKISLFYSLVVYYLVGGFRWSLTESEAPSEHEISLSTFSTKLGKISKRQI